MTSSFGVEFKEKLTSLGRAVPSQFKGMTEQEIEEVRIAQRVEYLPEIYRQFLLHMGRGAGRLFQGLDYTYSDLLDIKEAAIEFGAEDDPPFELPEDAFVFRSDQGVQFLYFHTIGKEDDPAVYSYVEGDRKHRPLKLADKLSEFFYNSAEEEARISKEQREQRRKNKKKRSRRLLIQTLKRLLTTRRSKEQ